MQGRFVTLLVTAGAIAALDGCGSVSGIRAQFENVDRPDMALYAMNGTAASLPAAILLRVVSAVPVTADFNFDIALDLDDTGAVVVHTVKSVASEFVPAHRVGLDTSALGFQQVTRAPASGFHYDSSMVVRVGQTVLVQSIDPGCSIYSLLGQNVHAKLVVDSVKRADRRIFLHLFVDPNCGFRSLEPGTPKE